MDEDFDSAGSGFLDIATNTLAVVMIVTMFSLLTVRPQSYASKDPSAILDPPLRFHAPTSQLFRPFTTYYFVFENRVVPWDQESFVEALFAGGPGVETVTGPQGRVRLQGGAATARDVDEFQALFLPDFEAMAAQAAVWDDAATGPWLEGLSRAVQTNNAPTFIVYRSGMDLFARLYPRLRDWGIRFRWYAWQDKEPLKIVRRVSEFTSFRFLW